MINEDMQAWLNFLEIFSQLYPNTYNTPEKALEGYQATLQHYNDILILLRKGKGT